MVGQLNFSIVQIWAINPFYLHFFGKSRTHTGIFGPRPLQGHSASRFAPIFGSGKFGHPPFLGLANLGDPRASPQGLVLDPKLWLANSGLTPLAVLDPKFGGRVGNNLSQKWGKFAKRKRERRNIGLHIFV